MFSCCCHGLALFGVICLKPLPCGAVSQMVSGQSPSHHLFSLSNTHTHTYTTWCQSVGIQHFMWPRDILPAMALEWEDTVNAGLEAHALIVKSARKYALKYQYEIDHTHVYGWVRVVKCVPFACTWTYKSKKLSTNGDQKEDKSFCLIQISRSSHYI